MINYAYIWNTSICSIVFRLLYFFSVIWLHFRYWFKRISHKKFKQNCMKSKIPNSYIYWINSTWKQKAISWKVVLADCFWDWAGFQIFFSISMRSMNERNKYGFCHSLASCSYTFNTYYALLQTTEIHISNFQMHFNKHFSSYFLSICFRVSFFYIFPKCA